MRDKKGKEEIRRGMKRLDGNEEIRRENEEI
jgi:hypothetical protein